uniref:Uncharacterized protein n=1 Tax=Sphaeramia orbicularis TaxID=375764 RepID=A0A672YYP0_9TELE
EEGQLMSMGSDGAVRGWDLDDIDAADVQNSSSSGRFEMEPMNELIIGHNVSLVSAVKIMEPSWSVCLQDSSGGIWKLDLSFTNTVDPQCLFSFHSGAVQGMDVSRRSHLMATTALDRSVRVFDFLAKKELTCSRFNQGGTTLRWAPPPVNPSGGLLVAGFEDGVVRLLQLQDLHKLNVVTGRSRKGEAELCLNQAFKPHNAPVTAVAYERNGQMLATGSSDCTVFFFTVGDKYEPVGFIRVPGPVQGLEWSPQAHQSTSFFCFLLNKYLYWKYHDVTVYSDAVFKIFMKCPLWWTVSSFFFIKLWNSCPRMWTEYP